MSDLIVQRLATWLIRACAATLVVTGVALALPDFRLSLAGDSGRPDAYAPGSAIDVDRSLYSAAPRTVFFFARASCAACQRSKDQFARIVAELRGRRDVQVLLLHPKSQNLEPERAYAQELGVHESSRIAIEPKSLKLQHVPAIAVVNRQGSILAFYDGIPTDETRSAVVHLASKAGVD